MTNAVADPDEIIIETRGRIKGADHSYQHDNIAYALHFCNAPEPAAKREADIGRFLKDNYLTELTYPYDQVRVSDSLLKFLRTNNDLTTLELGHCVEMDTDTGFKLAEAITNSGNENLVYVRTERSRFQDSSSYSGIQEFAAANRNRLKGVVEKILTDGQLTAPEKILVSEHLPAIYAILRQEHKMKGEQITARLGSQDVSVDGRTRS